MGAMARGLIMVWTLVAATAGHSYAQGAAGLSLAEAKKALTAAEASAATMKVALSCAVVDSRGDLIMIQRMDKARFFTPDIARAKARASALFGAPSGGLSGMAASRIDTVIDGQMLMLQGAVPLAKGGAPNGAIGCSGGSGQQDEDAAKAGAAAL